MATAEGVFFYDYNIEEQDQQAEILSGLNANPKRISPKYFYDQTGSILFETITTLPEYYPTRCEIEILRNNQHSILEATGEDCVLIEYGSGASTKIRLLLDAVKPKAYVPLDISRDFLYDSAIALRRDFPWLEIHATCLDYRKPATLPDSLKHQKNKVAYFPGSSLGNFAPKEQADFLNSVRQTIGDHGSLLIGLDMVKPEPVLHQAYNDHQGVTAKFNSNVLNHINEITGASFNPDHFSHLAFFNSEQSRIEMHLVSQLDQVASLGGERIHFKQGEHIVTEYSYKFEQDKFIAFAKQHGFQCKQVWQDSNNYFALFYLQAC